MNRDKAVRLLILILNVSFCLSTGNIVGTWAMQGSNCDIPNSISSLLAYKTLKQRMLQAARRALRWLGLSSLVLSVAQEQEQQRQNEQAWGKRMNQEEHERQQLTNVHTKTHTEAQQQPTLVAKAAQSPLPPAPTSSALNETPDAQQQQQQLRSLAVAARDAAPGVLRCEQCAAVCYQN